jgi:hypothetical protein
VFYRVRRCCQVACRARRHISGPTQTVHFAPLCGRAAHQGGAVWTGSWSKGRSNSSPKITVRKGAVGTGRQIALEPNRPLLVGEFDGDVELPRAVARSVRAAAGVVIGEAGEDIRRQADIECGVESALLRT